MPFVFPGITQYLDAASDSVGVEDQDQRARVRRGWHADAAGALLSQAPTSAVIHGADEGRALLRRVDAIVSALEIQVAGIKAASSAVRDECGLADPEQAKTPKRRRQARKAGDDESPLADDAASEVGVEDGVGEPTGPPAKTQDVDRKADDDEKVGKRHDPK